MITRNTHTPKVLATVAAALLLCGLLAYAAAPARAADYAVSCGPGALISAINQANATPEPDTLRLARGCTYTFAAANNGEGGPNALPAITSRITIEGNGAAVERSRAAGTPEFRLLYVAEGGDLSLRSMAVRNGLVASGGGGILSVGALALDKVTVSGNASGFYGGGLNSDVLSGDDDGSTLAVTDSTVSGNTARSAGGGLSSKDADATLTVTDSTISNNSATSGDGGGIYTEAGAATVRGSTISGNTSDNYGGGIDNEEGLTLVNSTISGNTAEGYGGGLNSNSDATGAVVNVTITDNTADSDASGSGGGGGVYKDGSRPDVVLRGSIVAGNADGGGGDPDCDGPFASEGYNLIGAPSPECAITGETATNLVGANPRLGPLADNGGPTPTHALLSGSPAIDRVAATRCPPPATDQRGVSRPQDGGGSGPARCDIGAFEKEPSRACTIRGTNGNDTLRGTNRRDVICALGGNDRVFAAGAGDVIRGGPGNDQLQGEGGADEILGEAGKDVLIGGGDADFLVGGTQQDTLTGNDGDDTLNTRDNAPGDVSNGNAGRNTCIRDPGDTVANCT